MERAVKPKLLIVDDELVNRELLERIFIQKYQLFIAENAFAGLETLSQESDIAVVISDQNMPKMTGTEFLTQVAELMPDTMRILMTARTDAQDLIEAINSSQIYKFVAKPFKREEIVGIVQQAVETHRILTARTANLRTTLKEAEDRYQSLFENSVEGIFQADAQGKCTLANPMMAKILGYPSPEAFLTSQPHLPTYFADQTSYARFLELLQAQSYVANFEIPIFRSDRSKLWILLNVRVLRNEEGVLQGYEGTFQDISQRKRAEAGVQVLQSIILEAGAAADLTEALNIALHYICEYTNWVVGEAWMPSIDQRLLQLSPAWYSKYPHFQSFQELRCDLVLSNSTNLIAEVWRQHSPQWIWQLQEVSEEIFPRKEEALALGLQSCLAIPICTKQRVVAVVVFFVEHPQEEDRQIEGLIHAITTQLGAILQRKRDEEEIRRMNQELEMARDQALEASRAKSAFMATMSHELRTPLNAIIGYSEMLQEDAREEGRADIATDLHKIYTAGKQLLELINDILDISKIEAGKMELCLEEFSIRGLIQEVVDIVLPMVEKNHNELEVNCSEAIGRMHSDLAKVRQSLINLLSNASKFTHNGKISLSVDRKHSKKEDWITFVIQDTGIGMSEETIQKLFQPFTQADNSTTRRYGGTGLGLAITKRFCQMMNGDISVESQLEKGSTFTLYLPVRMGEVAAHVGIPAAVPHILLEDDVPQLKQPVVLVIDDDPYVHDLMKRFLNKNGFAVKMARSGLEGLELARTTLPDAIMLDVVMPGMDGWNVLGALKADPRTNNIPIIMITIDGTNQKGYALGVSDFVPKPINRDRLLKVLNRYRKDTGLSSFRILIVEDEADARQVLRWMLQKEGCTVIEAENGELALASIRQSRPDLILLDLMMPQMDGFQFVENLRREDPSWTIPIIVVTAMTLSQQDRSRLNGSVQKILQKGAYRLEELLQEIHRLLPQCVL